MTNTFKQLYREGFVYSDDNVTTLSNPVKLGLNEKTLEKETINSKTNTRVSPDDTLRNNSIKIKARIVTDFGTQFELFKKYSQSELDEIFKDNKVLIKDKLIFVFV